MPRHSPCALCSLTTSSLAVLTTSSNYVPFSFQFNRSIFYPFRKKSSNMKIFISMFATYFASSFPLFNFQDPAVKKSPFFSRWKFCFFVSVSISFRKLQNFWRPTFDFSLLMKTKDFHAFEFCSFDFVSILLRKTTKLALGKGSPLLQIPSPASLPFSSLTSVSNSFGVSKSLALPGCCREALGFSFACLFFFQKEKHLADSSFESLSQAGLRGLPPP